MQIFLTLSQGSIIEVDVNEDKHGLKSIDSVEGHMVSITNCQYWNISVSALL